MSLLDTASLIVTPNGYKEGKLYSVIPTDGSGDLSVTRATTATRVNSAGLVELVPYNLNFYSEDLSNSWYNKYNSSISTNSTTAPSGISNADKIIENTNNSFHYVETANSLSAGQSYTISAYLKKAERDFGYIGIYTFESKQIRVDLVNGTIDNTTGTWINTDIEDAGNGWYRVSGTFDAYSTSYFFAGPALNATTLIYTGNGTSGVYLWGAQLVEGSVAKDYQKTETRLNIPRLDYSNGTCPSILVEPQRTNFLIYSEQLIQGKAWAYTSGTFSVTENTTDTLDPFGNNNADKFNATTQSVNDSYTSIVGSGSMTLSIFAKKGTSDTILLSEYNVISGVGFAADFNLTTGVVISTGGSITGSAIEDFGNGWYRCSISGPDTSVTGNIHRVTTYTGTTYLFGLQCESGSYPTSYIPTTSASVTRNADLITKTSATALIGQTEGTIFLDFVLKNPLSATNRIISITESVWNTGGSIRLDIDYNKFTADFVNGGSNIGNIGYFTTVQPNTRYKVAIAYKENDCQMYINGVDAGSDTTTAAMPTCSELYLNALGGGFNAPYEASNINAAALWKTRLTNTQLAQLTTI